MKYLYLNKNLSNVDVVDTNDNAPEPSVASTCPFEPSDEGSVNVRLEPIVSAALSAT